MLLKIHDVVSGWIAGVIVGLIVIVFSFWGVDAYLTADGNPTVAKVNDRAITLHEFQRAHQNYRQQVQSRLDQPLDEASSELIRQQALNQLIESEVLNQLSRDIGMRLGDEAVVQGIMSIDAFYDDSGNFSQTRYEQALARVGMSSGDFEQQMRTEMLQQQLREAIIDTAFVTDEAVTRLALLEEQTRDIRHVTLDIQPLYDSIEVSEADIESYYQENIANYREPEQVRIAYIDLTIEDLMKEVSVSEEDLRAYYAGNEASYSVEEARKVSQMYIKLDRDADEATVTRARERMEFIEEKLDDGMAMEAVASEYEDRLGENFEHLSLGFTPREVMAPELDEVIFSLDKGELSNIIRSEVGMHIVRVDDVKGGSTSEFADVREEVEQDYRRREAEQQFFDYAERLATLTYEHPDTLEVAAEELGLEIRTSDWFTRDGGEGIAGHGRVVRASFGNDVLQQDLNSETLELDDSRLVVLRVLEHEPEQPLALDEVRDRIVDDIRHERAREQIVARGEAILAALRAGQSAEEVAGEFGFEWREARAVGRDDPDVSRAVLRQAFTLARPDAGRARYAGQSLGSGDFVVVGVTDVQMPSPDQLSADRRQEIRQQLTQAAAQNAWMNLLDNARAEASVDVNRQNIDS